MGLLTVQTIQVNDTSGDGSISFSYAALNASTTKVVIGFHGYVYDTLSPNECAYSSAVWDSGGNDDTVTQVSGAEAVLTFGGDRHIYSHIVAVDSPTTSAGTLVLNFTTTVTSGITLTATIYEFDSEADSGVGGSVATYTSNSDSGCQTTQTTGANDHVVCSVWSHQVGDANPYSVSGILTTEDLDSDFNSHSFGAGHGTASGGSDSATVTGDGSARRVCQSTYEVELTVSGGGSRRVFVTSSL